MRDFVDMKAIILHPMSRIQYATRIGLVKCSVEEGIIKALR